MDKLAELIASAAERLGLEATRIWPQMVLLTWVKAAVFGSMMFLADIIAIVLMLYFFRRGVKGRQGYHDELHAYQVWERDYDNRERRARPLVREASTHEGWFTAAVVAGVVCAILLFVTLMTADSTVGALVAPEAVTVMRLIGK
jgi:hypothetical protein